MVYFVSPCRVDSAKLPSSLDLPRLRSPPKAPEIASARPRMAVLNCSRYPITYRVLTMTKVQSFAQ